MALPGDIATIILTGTYLDMQGNARSGSVTFTPSTPILVDASSSTVLGAIPVTTALNGSGAFSAVLPCTSGLAPSGWEWTVTENVSGAAPRTYGIALPSTLGSSVDISTLTPAGVVSPAAAYLPVPSGTPTAGYVAEATGSGQATAWVAPGAATLPMSAAGDTMYGAAAGAVTRLAGNTTATRKFLRELGTGSAAAAPAWDTLLMSDIPGAVVPVPAPTGLTATDTPAVQAAITALATALASGPATLLFADGVYQVDSNSVVIRSPNSTTVASASSGAEPSAWVPGSAGTLTVASAAGFPPSGQLFVAASAGTMALVSYTGTTSTTFTGCLYLSGSPAGTLSTGGTVRGALSNFSVRSSGRTVIQQAPNRAGLVNNNTGDLMIVADCTDFRIENLTLDGQRDQISPLTPLTAAVSSGASSVTVAAGAGANFLVGQRAAVFGGLGTSDSGLRDFITDGTSGSATVITAIAPGGGSGGGDLITFSSTLANSYSQLGTTVFSDQFGPYAIGGAYLTPYQQGYQGSVAGRSLSGEDQQNNLHLLNCQRFSVSRVTSRNCWESPVKCGSGNSQTQLTDACSGGTITDCVSYHGYDQGVSLWVCSDITVKGCVSVSTGWAGVSMTASDGCTVTGNVLESSYYRIPHDTASGCGIAIEGGQNNVVTGNRIVNTFSDCIRLTSSPIFFGISAGSSPTLSAFVEGGTAAGTSIQVSASAPFQAGGRYSIQDGQFSEAITCATIVDSTHITLAGPTVYGHKSGVFISNRIGAGNVIQGNSLFSPQNGNGFNVSGHVRDVIKGNTLYGISAGNGIALTYSQQGSGAYIGGDGSVIEGNNIVNNTGGPGIAIDSVSGLQVLGNRVTGQTTQPGISAKGMTGGQIAGNFVSDTTTAAGIFLQNGTLAGTVCSKVTVSGNVIQRTSNEGVIILNGDSLTITGNVATSCGGNAGINPRGVTNSVISGNVCAANSTSGIQLDNNGGNYCLNNRVIGNTCRDDGSGYKATTGASQVQAYGIRETGNSDFNLFSGNEMDANGTAQLTILGTHSKARDNVISGSLIPAAVTTPGMPATTVAQQNATGHDVVAYITATTVTQIAVGATNTGMTSGMVYIPAGQTITLTYATGTPTWVWIAAG